MERGQFFGCLRYNPTNFQLRFLRVYVDIIQVCIFEFSSQVCMSSLWEKRESKGTIEGGPNLLSRGHCSALFQYFKSNFGKLSVGHAMVQTTMLLGDRGH